MARLDAATLAEFARVDASGLLTVVGGGFTEVTAIGPAGQMPLTLAFRVVVGEDEETPSFTVTASPPDRSYVINFEGQIPVPEQPKVIEGEYSVQATVSLLMAVAEEGIYRVNLKLSTGDERELRFRVKLTVPG